jgi:hypothetical protein
MNALSNLLHWLAGLSFAQWWAFGTSLVTISSLLYTFLPPVESFAGYPGFQKFYGFFLIWLKAFAINLRTAMSKAYGNDISATSNVAGTSPKLSESPKQP